MQSNIRTLAADLCFQRSQRILAVRQLARMPARLLTQSISRQIEASVSHFTASMSRWIVCVRADVEKVSAANARVELVHRLTFGSEATAAKRARLEVAGRHVRRMVTVQYS